MLAKITSAAVVGLDAVPITVEACPEHSRRVDIITQGLPSFTKVGTACQQRSPLN